MPDVLIALTSPDNKVAIAAAMRVFDTLSSHMSYHEDYVRFIELLEEKLEIDC
jgi:hypothetical protein